MRTADGDRHGLRAVRVLVAEQDVVSPAARRSGIDGDRRGRAFLGRAARVVNPIRTRGRSSAEGDDMSKRNLSLFLVFLLLPAALVASSHREAPLITEDPAADATDVYVFRSPDAPNTVTFVANYYPFLAAQGGPNFARFSDNVLYEIHIDNNGDAKEDITYQFRFRTDTRNGNTFLYNTGPVTSLDSPNLNVRQFYTMTKVIGPRRGNNFSQVGGEFQVAPWNVGPRSTPNYDANLATPAIGSLPNGGKVFCGPRDDPFWVDLGSIFDLLALRPLQSLHLINQPGNTKGVDGLKGANVMSIVLQVPITDVVQSTSNQIIGV